MICDYEGSDYKTRFWVNADRAYEDAVERVALRRMFPPRGKRMVEFGAGFGRLADLYTGYDEIILLDYSRTMLEQAQERWGNDPRFRFVAADIYHLPFNDGILSAATMIRVIHHIADVPLALAEIQRSIAPGGTFVLEFANKRNIKSVLRYALRKQTWNPHAPEPVEFVKLNFDFHPGWMKAQLRQAGFQTKRELAVSYLRSGFLKRVMPVQWMVYLDAALQLTAPLGELSPSVFTQNVNGAVGATDGQALSGDAIFRSPRSGQPLRREGDVLVCDADGTRWHAQGNFFDFKEPI
jgi:ubiquinone/menaquinone biosynthesis C-methylase UbiE